MKSEAPDSKLSPGRETYAGLFLVAFATLMYEIQLTRIFSITMWYHYAFMAISVAMFGMTVGSLCVYLAPGQFSGERVKPWLAISALAFAFTVVLSFIYHLAFPFTADLNAEGVFSAAATALIVSVPFILSGICTSLALTRFPGKVSSLYAADLIGAGLGCVSLVGLMNLVDGPSAVLVIAAAGACGGLVFAQAVPTGRLRPAAVACTAALAGFAVLNMVLYAAGRPLLHFSRAKLGPEPPAVCEKWNSYTRLFVFGDPFIPSKPWDWGLSPAYPADKVFRQLIMSIDAAAFTPICYFDGNLQELEHLAFDATNIAHYLRTDSNVLVVGVGGGRDILSSLLFKQKSVRGVEVNDAILEILNHRLADFTGHLDADPRVSFINEEAINYVARCQDNFDIIQVSLIDTCAATAAGGFALTENSIYTVEAWKLLLNHLSPRGVLSVSRWYYRERPGEIYRLTALATKTLTELGIKDTRRHIIIIGNVSPKSGELWPDGIGTILVSKEPFSGKDIETALRVCKDLQFEPVLTPEKAIDPTFAQLATAGQCDRAVADYALDISAPTDDRPYFFQMVKLSDFLKKDLLKQGVMSMNSHAIAILGSLLLALTLLTALCIFLPLLMAADKTSMKGGGPLLSYFFLVGVGFMLVEMSQMQRLLILLGSPVYGLTVVLFTLLIASGLGSLSTRGEEVTNGNDWHNIRLPSLIACLAILGLISQPATEFLRGQSQWIRIAASVALLFPAGFFMGMPVPLGLTLASRNNQGLAPWLWGVNGAASVLASVAAVAIALSFGISSTFWAGVLCYLLAIFCFKQAGRLQ